jgi:hypothetical protein
VPTGLRWPDPPTTGRRLRVRPAVRHTARSPGADNSASTAGTSAPRSAATSPPGSLTIASRRGLREGSRTRSPPRSGSSGRFLPQFVAAPQNTW